MFDDNPEEDALARRLSDPAMSEFLQIADIWGLSESQRCVLLGINVVLYRSMTHVPSGVLPTESLKRISHIIEIWRDINALLPKPENADGWVNRPNQAFNGNSALDVMLGGRTEDIALVRRYLDSVMRKS